MKQTKTFAFNFQGEFLLARPNKDWAVRSVNRLGVKGFFFTEEDVKKNRHKRFFNNLKKFTSLT